MVSFFSLSLSFFPSAFDFDPYPREGFLGAFVTTVVFGVWIGHLMGNFDYMVCAQEELTIEFFQNLKCDRDPSFVASIPVIIPAWLQTILAAPGIESLKLGDFKFDFFAKDDSQS